MICLLCYAGKPNASWCPKFIQCHALRRWCQRLLMLLFSALQGGVRERRVLGSSPQDRSCFPKKPFTGWLLSTNEFLLICKLQLNKLEMESVLWLQRSSLEEIPKPGCVWTKCTYGLNGSWKVSETTEVQLTGKGSPQGWEPLALRVRRALKRWPQQPPT